MIPARKPKILLYYPDFGALGGIERHILAVATSLQQRGQFEPVVVCSDGTPFFRLLQQSGIRVHGVWTAGCFAKPVLRLLDVFSMGQLWFILRREKPAAVHVHIGQAENLFFKALGYPLVYTFHGYGSLYSIEATTSSLKRMLKRLIRPMFGWVAARTDSLLFVSRAEQARMIREGYLSPGEAGKVLPNGLPVVEINRQTRQTDRDAFLHSLGLPADARCVTFINRLDSNKNPWQFVQLAQRLSEMAGFETLHFLMAGAGPLAVDIRKALKINPTFAARFHLLGHRHDVPKLLAASDLVVHIPSMEGFGLGVLEAMAAETPCLCYNVGGISDLMAIPEGQESLVSAGDFEGLVTRAAALLRQPPAKRQALTEALYRRAMQFDLSRMVAPLEAEYARVLNQAETKDIQPLVSVVLPVYNGQAMILRAVHSVLNQTYANLELLVVDDGSTDNTLALLEKVRDSRLRIIRQANSGVAVARNNGISKACGEYIAFIDADDLWFPRKISVELDTIAQHDDPVCLVYSWYYAVDDADRLVNLSPAYRDSGILFEQMLEREGQLLPSTTLIHRRVFEAVGGFPTDSYHEDRVFFIRACRDFPAYPTQQRLVIYRQSLSGRCRNVLRDFESAVSAEFSIVNALQPVLTQEELEKLRGVQSRNLLYRFLMYDFVPSARRWYHKVAPSLTFRGIKGMLALASLTLGFNALYRCRVTVQFVTRHCLLPWWRWKSSTVYHKV